MKPFGYKYNEAFWLRKYYSKNYNNPYGWNGQNVTQGAKTECQAGNKYG